ncbi:MAG: serine/threonine protein phosphatase [Clostridiales bacterium]|nr:serine/threonine protein phosphatase [Clostridiales bacterium]
MKIFAIADLHLSLNESTNKPMGVFGEEWENHAERLKEAWGEIVSERDIVLIPGDISWALRLQEAMPDIEWIHSLPGIKILSKGNHDLWWSKIKYLNSLYEDVIFLQNESYYIESENIIICATRGWPYPGSDEYTKHDEKIYNREILRLKMGLDSARKKAPDAKIIVALHYPPAGQDGTETEFTKTLEEYGVWKCVYGHLHGQLAYGKGIKGEFRGVEYKLVSFDYLGAKPKLIYDDNGV